MVPHDSFWSGKPFKQIIDYSQETTGHTAGKYSADTHSVIAQLHHLDAIQNYFSFTPDSNNWLPEDTFSTDNAPAVENSNSEKHHTITLFAPQQPEDARLSLKHHLTKYFPDLDTSSNINVEYRVKNEDNDAFFLNLQMRHHFFDPTPR